MAHDGETIRKARILAGLTQEQLAERVDSGRTGRSVVRWEKAGLPDRSPYARAVERELGLDDPAVLRAIAGMSADEGGAEVEPGPRDLDDASLLARLDADLAELKRRFAERAAPRRRMYGQPTPYSRELDELPHTTGATSHERDDSAG